MDLISGMRVFVSIADNGSLAKAGRELDLSPSVVSKHISALEDRLGARLLYRTTRSVSLTEVGLAYLDRARRIIGDVDEAEAAVLSATNAPRGHLRITAPGTFSFRHIAPHLPLFRERFPEVEIEMIISDEVVDLVDNNIDLGIRIAVMKDSSLIARKLAPNPRTLFASPEYIKKHGMNCGIINKVSSGSPHIVDVLDSKKIALVINTGGGNTEHRLNDAIALRRATLKNKVPYCTNMSTALACIEGIKSLKTKKLEVTSLQNI